MEETQVYAASCPDYEQAEVCIRALVEQMGGMDRFVRPGERIVLKANLLRAAPPESAICTHPAVVEAVARLVKEAGGTPVICDSPGGALHKESVPRSLYEKTGMAAAAAAAQMAGCGPGLTPSSDDFLTGFMAALLTRSAADHHTQPVLALTRRMADAACPKTNAISGGFLAQSAQGLFSEDVISTMTALFSEGDPQALSDAAYKVACFGETSGTDILTGIYFGAKI